MVHRPTDSVVGALGRLGSHTRREVQGGRTVPSDANELADTLLDMQVDWIVSELVGPRLREFVARDVDDLLRIAGELRVQELFDAPRLKASVRRLVDLALASPLLAEVVESGAAAVYSLPGEQLLGDVVAREPVEAIVGAVLGLSRLYDRASERTAESPLVGALAGRFVTRIVGDVLQQNRQLAEKVPGVSSLFSMGLGAAAKVRSLTVDQLLPDAADKGAQFAIRRTNGALRDLIRDPSLKAAILELWDLQAAEPIGALREYITDHEVGELLVLLRELAIAAGGTRFAGEIVDGCIDTFLDKHGTTDVAALLAGLGVDRDELVEELVDHGSALLQELHARGELSSLIRARLAPFFESAAVRAVLGGDQRRTLLDVGGDD
jgi:hypothetical protein